MRVADKIMAMLSDGQVHHRNELFKCCDQLGTIEQVKVYICELRKELNGDKTIATISIRGETYYQLIVAPANLGK